MSETETTKKPDPTFLKDDNIDLRKPLGLAIEKPVQALQDEPKEPRLTRKEFAALLDGYYADNEKDTEKNTETAQPPHQARLTRLTGARTVRNLALVSGLVLFFGVGFGLYEFSRQGGETPPGQNYNLSLATIWQGITSSAPDRKTGSATATVTTRQNAAPIIKPIKTASLIVNDASGTIQAGIPLKLSLNAGSDTSLLQVKIINVPGDAVLTAGIRRGDGVWILQPADLKNVSLVVSSDRKTPLRLDIELIVAKTGELLSPTREIKVAIIQPEPFRVGGL